MRAEEILPSLWRIPVPLPGNPLKELNSYLIMGKGENLLIDTGFRRAECREALASALKELGVRWEETDVALTHLHSDHSGLAPEFVGPERKIYSSGAEVPHLRQSETWGESWGEGFSAMGFADWEVALVRSEDPASSMSPVHCEQYAAVEEGDILTCGEYALKVISTPGHTPGQICFYLEKEKVMFTGDHVLFDITPNITNWDDLPDALGAYLQSLDKIDRFQVDLALPGHRKPGELHRRVAQLKEHHRFRLEEARQALKTAPGSTAYELAGHLTWQVRGRTSSWADFPLSQKWFAVGECQAHLDRLNCLGELSRYWDGKVWRYEYKEKENG